MANNQQYCLKWKFHHTNLLQMFSQLLANENFTDVVLACEGKILKVHKMVLSSCSTYFQQLFTEYQEPNPIVILKDMKYVDIHALVEFMYKGEINVMHDQLPSLLKTAESLHVKGLAEVSGRAEEIFPPPTPEDGQADESEVLPDIPTERAVVVPDEPPAKRKRGRPSAMDASQFIFDPKIESVFGSFGSNASEVSCHAYSGVDYNDSMSGPSSLTGQNSGSNDTHEYDNVIKMTKYLLTGTRQQFWDEPSTKHVIESIRNKKLEMKKAAEILGVSYGTLYGHYREQHGCLKHPHKEGWSRIQYKEILDKFQRKELDLNQAADLLNNSQTAALSTPYRSKKTREHDLDEFREGEINDSHLGEGEINDSHLGESEPDEQMVDEEMVDVKPYKLAADKP